MNAKDKFSKDIEKAFVALFTGLHYDEDLAKASLRNCDWYSYLMEGQCENFLRTVEKLQGVRDEA